MTEVLNQFNSLYRGSMTVDEYYAKFVELSQYAFKPGTHYRLQVVQFISCLRCDVKSCVKILPVTNLIEAVATAQRVEAQIAQDQAKGNKGKPGTNNRKMNKKNQNQWQGQGSQSISNNSGSCGSSGGHRFTPYGCHNCGPLGHFRRN